LSLRKRCNGVWPISAWTLRLYSNSTHGWVTSLSWSSVRSATPQRAPTQGPGGPVREARQAAPDWARARQALCVKTPGFRVGPDRQCKVNLFGLSHGYTGVYWAHHW
jgi:hypothetical protein